LVSARWHLIAGPTGAGKTTFSRELAQRVSGVRFSIDEWMTALYWMDCPEKDDLPWALERIARCETQIEAVARQLASVGLDAVLDLGFTVREQRATWLERARAAGLACELHVLDVPAQGRWERVSDRNQGATATYSFAVTREMFDFMEARWELPGAEERALFEDSIAARSTAIGALSAPSADEASMLRSR
jgi:predicted kinase